MQMGLWEAIVSGFLAAGALLLAAVMLAEERYRSCIVCVIIELILVLLSGYYFWLALGDSGKVQAWLCFPRYPVLLIYLLISAAGIFCIVKSLQGLEQKGLRKKRKRSKAA